MTSLYNLSPEEAQQSYFPHAEGSPPLLGHGILSSAPLAFELYDEDSLSVPLPAYDQLRYDASYVPREAGDNVDMAPEQPPTAEPYLIPSLTQDERMRLTLLWYHTRDLCTDTDFLQMLQSKLDMVVELMGGFEIAILGLVSEDSFTRLVTIGAPRVSMPRRESTCSHTITQPPGVSDTLV